MTKSRGFTLVEMIAVMVIIGIIAAAVGVFIARPVAGYVDAVRRAALSDLADTALRRIGRDVRLAVPNSVRVSGNTFLEYIPTRDGVRYRAEADAGGGGDILDFTLSATESTFDIFPVSAVAATAGDFMAVFNTGQCDPAGCAAACTLSGGANAYQGCNRRVLSAVSATAIGFSATALPLPFDSPGHRVNFVPSSGPVSYACEGVGTVGGNGTGTLRRYTGYATGSGGWNAAAQPTPPFGGGATSALLADSVSACAFTYLPGVTQTSGLVTLSLTLTRVSESVTLYYEIHVDNQP
ncbi:MAG: type II secretion system GspH family protein [Rhodocyclaceae bacterium]|nr:type II secretion system GspH family protein [Rhodocyclaceae bacterium]